MVKGNGRDDVIGQELVDEVVVVVDTRLVPLPDTIGQNSRPPDGEPVAVEPHGFQELDVLLVFVIGVAGNVSAGPVLDIALNLQHHCRDLVVLHPSPPWPYLGESVPDVDSLPVLVPGPLDLVGSRSTAPHKVLREVIVEELLLGGVGQGGGEEDGQQTPGLHLSGNIRELSGLFWVFSYL